MPERDLFPSITPEMVQRTAKLLGIDADGCDVVDGDAYQKNNAVKAMYCAVMSMRQHQAAFSNDVGEKVTLDLPGRPKEIHTDLVDFAKLVNKDCPPSA